MRVADFGEHALIQRLQAFCPPHLVGDDAAVLDLPPGQQLVVTTDGLIDGVHFSLGLTSQPATMTAVDAGWRAVAANLSDLASMGATPVGITVALGLPADLPVSTVEDLYQGMTQCLQSHGGDIIGGDIYRSPALSLGITALGQASPERVIRRAAAQVGDAILVSGPHGRSRTGLELLLKPELQRGSEDSSYIQAHRRPTPRLDALPALHRLQVKAGMDSSDGLADAVLQICRASGVGAVLDRTAIDCPTAPWLQPQQALEWALYGGE
ncbi:MAG: thiamine-phosphate kinase, partial [Cyanobacteria bacterium P01_A01_bin.135]